MIRQNTAFRNTKTVCATESLHLPKVLLYGGVITSMNVNGIFICSYQNTNLLKK